MLSLVYLGVTIGDIFVFVSFGRAGVCLLLYVSRFFVLRHHRFDGLLLRASWVPIKLCP